MIGTVDNKDRTGNMIRTVENKDRTGNKLEENKETQERITVEREYERNSRE